MSLAPWRTVIADDHQLMLSGVRAMLEASGRVEVVATAADGLAAIAAVSREKPDLAILDLAMPHANGMEAYLEARRWSPGTRFVLFSGALTPAAAAALAEEGVSGLFLKTGDPEELIRALPRIMQGGQVFSAAAQGLLEQAAAAEGLTARELQMLQAVARGATNAQAAETLGISPKTVDKHRTNLMRKLGAHSTAELVMTGVRLGLLQADGTHEG
ncbi:response regulator [Rhodovulum sp. DZ06]|uniref:response regulator n=1 Tax=Rhodovulum sp. DZ06 TaxID=3425126 RepID=UPI003D340662